MTLDLGLALWRRGYHALPALWREAGAPGPATTARLLGRRTLVVRGEEGARLFYDEDRVRRRDAVPPAVGWLIFGRGGVQGLDGEEHRERKSRLLSALAPEAVERLRERVATGLAQLPSHADHLDLHDTLATTYGTAVLEWAGTPARGRDAVEISRELVHIVDGLGYAGTAGLTGWRGRRRTERWAGELVRNARNGVLPAPSGTALAQVALTTPHLPVRVAAVELLNIVRPTVAVAWLGTWAAGALAAHPELREELARDPHARHAFAQEVRRCTPFVPTLAGRLRSDGEFHGCPYRRRDRVLIDVPAVDNDERVFPDPHRFRPERFAEWEPGAFEFMPQGAGHAETGHRCPGEGIALALVEETLRVLAERDLTPPPGWDPRPGGRIPPALGGPGWRLRPPAPVSARA